MERDKWRILETITRSSVVNSRGETVAIGSGRNVKQRREHATQIVTEHNQHTTLVEQRDLLVAALREVRAKFFEHAQAGAHVVKGNLVPLDNEQHPWIPGVEAPSTIQIIDNALATVEQGEGHG